MSHHLAELVVAADKDATIEQRLQIVDLILKIWTNRRCLPDPPLAEYEPVLSALERLGDSRPWVFSRIHLRAATSFGEAEAPLISTAIELEQLTRETLLRLIWIAAHDASAHNKAWLELADEVTSNLESGVESRLRDLRLALEAVDRDDEEPDEQSAEADKEQPEHLSDHAHATHLREMAALLTRLAQELTDSGQAR